MLVWPNVGPAESATADATPITATESRNTPIP